MLGPKTSSRDFDKSMLPKNRKEVLSDVIKHNFGKLIMMGVVVLGFSLPLIINVIINDSYSSELLKMLGENSSDDEMRMIISSIMTQGIISSIVNIVGLLILSICLSGLFRVLRQYLWGENVEFHHDFIVGIKQNYKQFMLTAFLVGILSFIINYIDLTSELIIKNGVLEYLVIIPKVVFFILILPILLYQLVSTSIYSNSYRNNLKIGRVCYFNNFFKTLLLIVLGFLPYFVTLIPNFYCHVIGRAIYFIMVPYLALIFYSNALVELDKNVNKKYHPELIDKGVYKENVRNI